jgi:hypothetical protein
MTTRNEYFRTVASLDEAADQLVFVPIEPADTAGLPLDSLAIHVRDVEHGELPVADRSLELHYGGFVVSQARKGEAEAQRWATGVRYGRDPEEGMVAGHPARVYGLGPEPDPDDIDGRSPAVVVWQDGEMLYLVASGTLDAPVLLRVAESMYPGA